MNYLQSYIPVAIKLDNDEFDFNLKNLNNLENNDDNEDIQYTYEPFIIDDISLDYSKIPAITISNKKLLIMDLQTRNEYKPKNKSLKCPYAPIEIDDQKETEENSSDETENDSDSDQNPPEEEPEDTPRLTQSRRPRRPRRARRRGRTEEANEGQGEMIMGARRNQRRRNQKK